MSARVEAALAGAKLATALLAEDCSIGTRAAAIAAEGHRTWFARQDGQHFTLTSPGGGLAADPEKAFTTDATKLVHVATTDDRNTVVFDVVDETGYAARHVYNLESRQIERWRDYQTLADREPRPATNISATSKTANSPSFPTVPIGELPNIADARSALVSARADLDKASANVCAAEEAEATLVRNIRSYIDQASALEKRMGERLAQLILQGGDVGESQPETTKIRRLNNKRRGTEAALPDAREATQFAKVQREKAKARWSEATLDWAAAHQGQLLAIAEKVIADLTPVLVELIAIDRVKSSMLGRNVVTNRPNHPALLSTERLTARLVKEIPARLAPPTLSAGNIEREVAAAMAGLLLTLEK